MLPYFILSGFLITTFLLVVAKRITALIRTFRTRITVLTKEIDDASLVESEIDFVKALRGETMFSENIAYRDTRVGMTELPKSG